jgi:CHAT domain-containing protein/tetratricopeptide (TPR) repeat protein
MTSAAAPTGQDELIDALAGIRQARARATFLRRNRQLWDPSVVERIYARVVRLARTDLDRADGLARAAHWIAEQLGDEACRAQSLRAIGHVHHIRGEYAEALEHYQAARAAYLGLGRDIDVARTLNGALQSLICLGRYDEALAWAAEAREIFERHGNLLGLARLDSNVGNILYRQDRFADALVLIERAHEQLARVGEPQDVAATLSNIAVVQISLNGFDNAVRAYHEARAFCERHDMPLLTLRADYNIAGLYYMRGEYTRALEMYRVARGQSDRLGDPYHGALCDLDRSEIYLELNLADEAAELAAQALKQFEELGMNYEAAKAVTILALTTSRGSNRRGAHALFNRARRLFAREHNQVWLGLLDFYEALALFRDERYAGATLLCHHARRQLEHHLLPGKAALCDLLLSRLALQSGDVALAEQACRDAFDKLAGAEAPMATYQAHCGLGLVREAQGDPARAFDAFQQAAGSLEHLRNHLQSESLRVAFLEDKLDVYERLVTTCLTSGPADEAAETAFGYIEKAKSRSLADLIALRAINVAPRGAGEASDQVRHLRQELIWYSQQVEQEELKPEGPSARRIESFRGRARGIEQQLVKALNEIEQADDEFSVLQSGTTFTVDEIRASLAPGAIILEYYQAMGRLYVCVLSHDHLEIVPLGAADDVRSRLKLLQFQLARFRRDPDNDAVFAEPLRAATEAHLGALYALLIAPIRNRLQASHLVVIPHGVLHTVPFHALFDGERFLIDDFTISYAPSASVHRLCWAKPAAREAGSLVMGVPDARAPFIADEVHAVAAILPDSQVFLGESATSGQLQLLGARSQFVHIATHGVFRKDNAMFSSIRLGDGPLSVYDLYQLQLSAELVTLSGCGTGLSVTVGGDEQVGLVRGLLYAGAAAVMLTLWDAHDRSTADFMQVFYTRIKQGSSKARAAQAGMWALREKYPHPFYWAPFTIVGNAQGSA